MNNSKYIDTNLALLWHRIDSIWDGFIKIIPVLTIGIIVFLLLCFLGVFFKKFIIRSTKDRTKANLGIVLGRLSQWAISFIALLSFMAIVIPSVTAGKIVGALGIGGVAIGFAFKDILQNFLAGILILLREPFKINDEITYKNFTGVVIKVETRSTNIKTFDGRVVLIPNGEIYTNAVTVNSAYKFRRSEIDIGIGYNDDITNAVDILLKVLNSIEGIKNSPEPEILVTQFADSAIILKARWWTKSKRAVELKIRSEVVRLARDKLFAANIDIPFPIRTIHMEKNS